MVHRSPKVFAYAVPGANPLTVVSHGLLAQLDTNERDIVLAHEAAHHVHRHDRYVLIGELAAAIFAPVRFVVRGLEHALERWADEHTAAVIGDRRTVALTVARVALLRGDCKRPVGVLGFALHSPFSTTRRVRSLLQPPPVAWGWSVLFAGGGVVCLAAQVHHFDGLMQSICRI
jgi:predicted Zn-dependent protease